MFAKELLGEMGNDTDADDVLEGMEGGKGDNTEESKVEDCGEEVDVF